MTRVRVIGAGLSGLATAWYLTEAGAPAHVVEASAGPGGLIGTRHEREGQVETAAHAFVRTPQVDALFRALHVEAAELRPDVKRRFIFRDGRPRRWPLRASETAVAAFRFSRAGMTGRLRAEPTETVAAWATRVFGARVENVVIDAVMRGIYAAPAVRLAAPAVFAARRSHPRGRSLIAPQGGMGELIDSLQAGLERRGVTFEWNTPATSLLSGQPTVIAVGAPAAAVLLAPHVPLLAAAIAGIEMRSLLTVTAFFDRRATDLRGFGVLFPRNQGVTATGVLFNTDIFNGRSDWRSETWMYDVTEAEGCMPEQLIADRRVLTGRADRPRAWYPTRRPDAIPVYGDAVLRAARQMSDLPPWLALAGNYLGRLGVAKLLGVAADAARRMTSSSSVGSN